MSGFYVTIIGEGIIKITDYKDNNLILCFSFLLVAFSTTIISLFRTVSYNKLEQEEKKDHIRFREDDNLPQFNVKLFSALRKQTVFYINSFVSIAFSLFSLIGYCLNYVHFYLFSLIIMILTLALSLFPSFCLKVVDSSAKYRTRNYVKINLSKVFTLIKTKRKTLLRELHDEDLTSKNMKNFNRVIIVLTVTASLILTFIFKETITANETYIILPI